MSSFCINYGNLFQNLNVNSNFIPSYGSFKTTKPGIYYFTYSFLSREIGDTMSVKYTIYRIFIRVNLYFWKNFASRFVAKFLIQFSDRQKFEIKYK